MGLGRALCIDVCVVSEHTVPMECFDVPAGDTEMQTIIIIILVSVLYLSPGNK